jgi:hypothetical protein
VPREFEGTPAYASVEALRHHRTSEPFDLARVTLTLRSSLFELLTGELPVTVSSEEEEAAGDDMLA